MRDHDLCRRAIGRVYEVRVSHRFNASRESVFAGISDHERFLSAGNIDCRLLRVGVTERNGQGAVRRLCSGLFRFEEEITRFHSPRYFEYKIRSFRGPLNFKMPFHHDIGCLRLNAVEQQTEVVWTSRFHFMVPVFGDWLDRKLGATIGETFLFFLRRLDARLQDSSGGT